ncbi:MAG TPA: sigma-70 family RNA polymerase sigma factor [Ktedonobacterales bacterium]
MTLDGVMKRWDGAMREDVQDESTQELSFSSFTALVEQHERALYVFLHGTLSDAEQARDLVQDTFYDAWRAAKRRAPPFVPGAPHDEIRRWLFHTAYCRAISTRRRRRLFRFESLSSPSREIDGLVGSIPFEDAIAEHDALRGALAGLAPEDIACLVLIVVQGFTAAEAGRIMGVTSAATAKRLSRAKRRLLSAYIAANRAGEEPHP